MLLLGCWRIISCVRMQRLCTSIVLIFPCNLEKCCLRWSCCCCYCCAATTVAWTRILYVSYFPQCIFIWYRSTPLHTITSMPNGMCACVRVCISFANGNCQKKQRIVNIALHKHLLPLFLYRYRSNSNDDDDKTATSMTFQHVCYPFVCVCVCMYTLFILRIVYTSTIVP